MYLTRTEQYTCAKRKGTEIQEWLQMKYIPDCMEGEGHSGGKNFATTVPYLRNTNIDISSGHLFNIVKINYLGVIENRNKKKPNLQDRRLFIYFKSALLTARQSCASQW